MILLSDESIGRRPMETFTKLLCVQRRLHVQWEAVLSPTEAKVRGLVAWIAGRRGTEFLKPIDEAIHGMVASHRAVMKVNA
jgi:hypothetical protein